MNSNSRNNSLGGYLELELRSGREFHVNAVALNTARNGFEYILRAQVPSKIFMPKYTCDVMFEPLKRLNIPYELYSINKKFEIVNPPKLRAGEMIVYTNYFGVKNEYSDALSQKYASQLIMDCSQAFYYKPFGGVHAIYSPRKFFGVADGGYVITDKQLSEEFVQDTSYSRMKHLLKRIDLTPEEGFEDYQREDKSLTGQPIKRMSKLTQKILEGVDYKKSQTARRGNFAFLDDALGGLNKLTYDNHNAITPMVYPYLIDNGDKMRKILIKNQIYVATYWPNVIQTCSESEVEYNMALNILAIPIDQRYGIREMERIIGYLQ